MEKNKCNNCGTENPITNKYCSRCGYELPKIFTVVKDEPVKQQTTKKNVVLDILQKSTKKRKLSIKGIIGLVVMIVIINVVQQLYMKTFSYDKMMLELASELNKSCPLMADSITRLDNVAALSGNVLQYNYTLINMEKKNIDIVKSKNKIEPRIINNVRTIPNLQKLRDQKTTFKYLYKDENGEYLFTISVAPEQYE